MTSWYYSLHEDYEEKHLNCSDICWWYYFLFYLCCSLQRIFRYNAGWIWNEYDERIENIFWVSKSINQSKDGVYVHKSKYTKELLKKVLLEDCKLMTTPMHPNCNLKKEETSSKIDLNLYIGMVWRGLLEQNWFCTIPLEFWW